MVDLGWWGLWGSAFGVAQGPGWCLRVLLATVEDAGDELVKVFKLGGRAGVPVTLM